MILPILVLLSSHTARDVKPFSMSSTRPVDCGGKGNPLIESIPDDAPLTRPTYSGAGKNILGSSFLPQFV
jgi:hypothetical protein